MTTRDEIYHLYDPLWPDFPDKFTVRTFLQAQVTSLTAAQQKGLREAIAGLLKEAGEKYDRV